MIAIRSVACILTAAAAIAFAGIPEARAAERPPARITHFETATDLAVDKAAAAPAFNKPSGPAATRLRFQAFGNRFDVELEPNYRLVTPLIARGQLAYEDVNIFTGALPSVPGSWARFTLDGERVTGVLSDGTTMFLVDVAENVQSLLPAAVPASAIVVFRAADVYFPIEAGSATSVAGIAGDDLVAHSVTVLRKGVANLPTRSISLGLLGDSEYASIESPELQAMTVANQADGIFTAQMDIHFRVERLDLFDASGDPFLGSSDAGVLLDRLVDFKATSAAHAPLGLVHLLTRRFLDDDIGGIALLGSVCGPTAGAGITVNLQGIPWLIMAHEIAHNFGAPHDGEPGACASTPQTFLMAPEYNDSEEFSPCSLQQMEQFLAQATCLTSVGPGELELAAEPLPPALYYNEPIRINYFVNSIGNDSVFDVSTRIEASPDFTLSLFYTEGIGVLCEFLVDPERGECRFGTMHGGGSAQFGAEIIPRTTGTAQLLLQSSGSNDTDPSNNDAVISVEIEPATYIFSRGDGVPDIGRGQTAVTTIKVENEGDFPSAATLRISTEQVHALATSAPFCQQPDSYTLLCDIETMAAREVRRFEIEFTPEQVEMELDDQLTLSIFLETTTVLHGSREPDFVLHFVTLWGSYKDIRSDFAVAPPNLTQGDGGEFTVAVINDGPDATIDTTLEIAVSAGDRIEEAAWEGGTCTRTDRRATCEIASMDAGERIEVPVRFTAIGSGTQTVTVMASGIGFDYDPDNNAVTASHALSGAQVPGESGGGGGAPLWLLLLVTAQSVWRAATVVTGGRRRTRTRAAHRA